MIEVWHFNSNRADAGMLLLGDVEATKQAWAERGYTKVAEVQSDDLETAFRWTNNVDTSWSREPAPIVTVTAELPIYQGQRYGLRSSSMGDVFVRDGKAYYVAMIGFAAI